MFNINLVIIAKYLILQSIVHVKARLPENEVMADPHIMCEEQSIGLEVDTKMPFSGRMFVNGMSEYPTCVRQFDSQQQQGRFEIPFGSCDMRAARVLHPRAGLEYSTTMVVSFHSELLTMTDRAFHIKCRYYQQDRSIGSYVEVSMMPTVILTSSFPMPNCRYTLHVRAMNGPAAQFARIGDPVYHRWECDSDLYGMKVKSCYVDDGRKKRYMLVDASGCASDSVILPDLIYEPSLKSAYVETHVFKFADRAHVFFQCQIGLCLKSENACQGITVLHVTIHNMPEMLVEKIRTQPPNCDPRYRNQRTSRSLDGNSSEMTDPNGELDVSSQSLMVLDIGDGGKFDAYVQSTKLERCDVCLPTYGFAGLISATLLTLAIASATTLALCRSRERPMYMGKTLQLRAPA